MSQTTKILIVFLLRLRHKELAKPFQLLRGQRQPAIILAIFQKAIFDIIFGADLNEVSSDAGAQKLRPRFVVTGIAGGIDAVGQGYDRPASAHIFARRIAKDLVGDSSQCVIEWGAIAGPEIFDRRP